MQNQMLPYKADQRLVAVEDVRNGYIAAFIGDYTQVQYFTQVSDLNPHFHCRVLAQWWITLVD
jgi:hypothetical protein